MVEPQGLAQTVSTVKTAMHDARCTEASQPNAFCVPTFPSLLTHRVRSESFRFTPSSSFNSKPRSAHVVPSLPLCTPPSLPCYISFAKITAVSELLSPSLNSSDFPHPFISFLHCECDSNANGRTRGVPIELVKTPSDSMQQLRTISSIHRRHMSNVPTATNQHMIPLPTSRTGPLIPLPRCRP
jgi:hypothetical protein